MFFTKPNYKFCSLYKKKEELLQELLDRFSKKVKEEVEVPWPAGYLFNEDSPEEWVKLLAKIAGSEDYIVFGKPSNIYGEFTDNYKGWEDVLSIIWRVDFQYQKSIYCTKPKLEEKFKYGFYPNWPTLMGPLPRCIIWKCFKVR